MRSVCRHARLYQILIVLVGVTAARCTTTPQPVSSSATRLEIEVFGGFAYVPSSTDNQLEIGFLKSTTVPNCTVSQLGVDLFVSEGSIVAPATPPPSNRFDVSNAVVTFPGLDDVKGGSKPARGKRPPDRPGNPNDPAQWTDLKWIPDVNMELPSPSSLNPNWRTMVDGRAVLKGGTLRGLPPSLGGVRNRVFEFRNAKATQKFTQAVTDMTRYDVTVPSDQVIIRLQTSTETREIIVKPTNANRPVKLRFQGRHDSSSDIADHQPIHHFCAFYQLLQPIPDPEYWLLPHLVPVQPGAGPGSPSPGRFCPGDIYMEP